MDEIRKPKGWRSFAVKMAVLCLVWTLLTTMLATRFYLLEEDWTLKVFWKQAFLHGFMESVPWMFVSPAVVHLAERFRFDRSRWLWGVFPHLPACVLVSLACQGVSMVLMQYEAGIALRSNAVTADAATIRTVVLPDFVLGTSIPPATLPLPGIKTQLVKAEAANQEASGIIFGGGQGTVSVPDSTLPPNAIPPGSPSVGAIQVYPPPWTRFLHLAATRAQYTIPIYWIIVCVTWVISYYQQLRERERRTLELEARLMQTSLQALKAQLQPHFLFNTLNTIASFVRRKPAAAEDMIASLSELLRMNLDAAKQHEVPLWREIKFLDLYLDIQQIRFGERLRIQKEIDPLALNVPVPTFILQPLIENSVRHGIEARENGGTILIRALRLGNSLRFEVRDDGEGLQGGQLAAIREGIGLSNTKARLQELYGDTHHFKITPNTDGGLTVIVELPWRVAEPDKENL